MHLHHDVASSNELSIHEELWNSGPIAAHAQQDGITFTGGAIRNYSEGKKKCRIEEGEAERLSTRGTSIHPTKPNKTEQNKLSLNQE